MSHDLPHLMQPETLAALHDVDMLLVHLAEAPAFERAHLPGARLVEPRDLVRGTPPAPGALPEQGRLEALFSSLGYRPDRQVVVYDDEGGGWAGRFVWIMDIIGHRRWSYLDGGLPAWHAAGGTLERGAAPAPERAPVALKIDPGPIAHLEDVLAAMEDPAQVIWDVRSAEEYRGEKSGSRRAGHIPGAVNLDWMRLKDPSRQLRLVADARELLAAHGIEPDKRVITHCQTHHRSGLSYLLCRLLGYPDIRAYAGSWAEWGNRDDTPVVRGPLPGEVQTPGREGGDPA